MKRGRAELPSISPSPRRRRLRTSENPWIVEEVQQPCKGTPPDDATVTSENPAVTTNQSGLSSDEVLQLISLFHKDKGNSQRLNNNQLNNVVPEFDPSSKNQNIDLWINKVNECSSIYEWDEKQTIHFALQKLTGLAKKWFECLPSVVYGWSEWQEKLRKAFPGQQNYGRLLEEMLGRTTRNNESLREYFYDKLSLISRCEIVGKKGCRLYYSRYYG